MSASEPGGTDDPEALTAQLRGLLVETALARQQLDALVAALAALRKALPEEEGATAAAETPPPP